MSNLARNLEKIESVLQAAANKSGRRREDVKLLAVSKTWPAAAVREAYSLGVRAFGENYVQEFTAKADELGDLPLEWHFIGHLQTNKVKNIIGRCRLIHSVDRDRLAREISRRQQEQNVDGLQDILLEVNVGGEASKSGVTWAELPALLDEVQTVPGLRLRGLMVMPPLHWREDELRRAFHQAREERDRLASRLSAPHSLLELSMGTSHDFGIAVECGATIVRLGTALFGERAYGRQ